MKLLMITRKVDKDDSQAGFTYGWVKKLGEKVNELKVICLEKGNINGLPDNIEVFSLGKERGKNRLREFINFQRGALKFIRQVDGVFCHQNPEYTILIFPYAKFFRKKIVSWYSHKAINWKVRLINALADKIVTPTREAFGLESDKKIVIGHGIDTELFKPAPHKEKNNIFRIISVGRISPIKDYKTLIEAISIMNNDIDVKVNIIGGLGLDNQQNYLEELQQMIKEKSLESIISFKNLIPNRELPKYYQESDLSINLCPTGSPDKAVLESMACGLPVLAANETFRDSFGHYADKLIFRHGNAEDLAKKIINLAGSSQLKEIGLYLREQVVKNHNLDNLMDKIVSAYDV
ncbi:glycosyltransferase family 4 protein [Patescibacteria group bacterium]|nr:glycosyltransferase family 4 protein [Patescibacteria group bacterium]